MVHHGSNAVFLVLVIAAAAVAAQPSAAAAAPPPPDSFKCGAPGAPCGQAIPPGISCPKGPGFCAPGHYCGNETNMVGQPRCLPLPADCGRAGKPCCPNNAEAPHTSEADKLARKPSCKDGSTCFYVRASAGWGDAFAGVSGSCTAVAPGCGLKAGSPCCPQPYHIESNPPLGGRIGCSASGDAPQLFCDYEASVCRANAPDCGTGWDKPCCVYGGPSGSTRTCGVDLKGKTVQGMQKAYCARSTSSSDSSSSSSDGRRLLSDFIASEAERVALGRRSLQQAGGGGSGSEAAAAAYAGSCQRCPAKVTDADVAKNRDLAPCMWTRP